MNRTFYRAATVLSGLSLALSGCGGQPDQAVTAPISAVSPEARAQAVTCGTTNLALNRPALSSADEGANTPARAAFDGDAGTRWASPFSDAQWVQVDLGSVQAICGVTLQWEGTAAYGKAFEIQTSNDGAAWTPIYTTASGTGGTQTLTVSGTGRYVRMQGKVRGTGYGYSLFEFQVFGGGTVVPPPPTPGGSCSTTNAALNQPATASSSEGAGTPPALAVDGSPVTRWASDFTSPGINADAQSLQVDLGSVQTVCGGSVYWESAYGASYDIEVSSDAQIWTSIASVSVAAADIGSPIAIVPNKAVAGRYVRLSGHKRGTGYGYSVREFVVNTIGAGTPPPPPPGPTPIPTPPTSGPGVTKVTGSQGHWLLTVDGQSYQVRGLTWGPPVSEAATRMPDLKNMGVNTVRIWGTDAGSQPLFDAAAANGVRVIAGFWLQPGGGPGSGGCVNYLTDSAYKANQQAEFLKWVNVYKAHKGLLMWDVGNESILGMQNCFSGAELENQRNAYAKYVNEVARAIHAADPNHPVTSTDAWTGAWAYLKANAPDLDLYAVNSYGAVCSVKQNWISGGYTKPYILTEGGPPGDWEVPADALGAKVQPTDVQNADGYTNAWGCLMSHSGVALGATMFHYGTEGDYGGVWFNITTGNERRLSYYAVRKMYGGAPTGNTPPVISSMALSNTEGVPAGGTFTLSASIKDPDGDPVAYTMGYNSIAINGSGGITAANFTGPAQGGPAQTSSGPWTVTAPQTLGVWKVYLYARDGHGNVGIETRNLRVVAPPVAGSNIALGKTATAKSYQPGFNGRNFFPSYVNDGDVSTNWGSEWSDPQWVQVDLGSVQTFNHVQLIWESAYGKAYDLQVSDDGVAWRGLYSTEVGDGNTDDIELGSVSGRYVRMNGRVRGTGYGYALYEFGVYRR